MLDGQVLGASQVEYKPFGKPPLKREVQACGCKIETPRYACNLAPGCISSEPTFAGLRKNKKRKQGVPKKGVPEKNGKGVSFGKG